MSSMIDTVVDFETLKDLYELQQKVTALDFSEEIINISKRLIRNLWLVAEDAAKAKEVVQ